ncbi:MAG: hypothetical protein NW206_00545 [Hyphomonadaceae bacterium]|nr:hypothetical protein [Hyphomonadaceae bacterium]
MVDKRHAFDSFPAAGEEVTPLDAADYIHVLSLELAAFARSMRLGALAAALDRVVALAAQAADQSGVRPEAEDA